MTRKDYVLIARAIKNVTEEHSADGVINGVRWAAESLATALKAQNSRFDVSRFLDACGVEHS